MKNERTAYVSQVDAAETAQVDAAETAQVDAAETAQVDPIAEKAGRMIRQRMEKLTAANLNFEKRTGNFFRATLEKVTEKDEDGNTKLDAKGQPIYLVDQNNKPIEKITRSVVNLDDPNAEGYDADAVEACADEIIAKRAAALVQGAETEREKLQRKVEAAQRVLDELASEAAELDEKLSFAEETVKGWVLPERETATRTPGVVAKLQAVEDANAKLRALLIAAGLEVPDELK